MKSLIITDEGSFQYYMRHEKDWFRNDNYGNQIPLASPAHYPCIVVYHYGEDSSPYTVVDFVYPEDFNGAKFLP